MSDPTERDPWEGTDEERDDECGWDTVIEDEDTLPIFEDDVSANTEGDVDD